MRRFIEVLGLLSLTLFPFHAVAQDDDKPAGSQTLMDDPRDQQRLSREIWESVKHTPYSQAVAYAKAAQLASRAASAPATVTLPTGWNITPAGMQVSVGTLPFDAVAFNGSVVVVDSGSANGPQDFRVLDPASATVLQTIPVQNVYPGAAVGPGGALYISGGFSNQVYRYDTQFNLAATYDLPGYVRGLAGYDSRYLVALYSEPPVLEGILASAHVVMIDTTTGNITSDVTIAINEPYSVNVVLGKIYVTVPAYNQVVVLDSNLTVLNNVNVGNSPFTTCQDGWNLFVVDENSDDVAVINTLFDVVIADFPVKFWGQKWGAGPTSCAVDGDNLYVLWLASECGGRIEQSERFVPRLHPNRLVSYKSPLMDSQLVVSARRASLCVRTGTGIRDCKPTPRHGRIRSTKTDIASNLSGWTVQVGPQVLL